MKRSTREWVEESNSVLWTGRSLRSTEVISVSGRTVFGGAAGENRARPPLVPTQKVPSASERYACALQSFQTKPSEVSYAYPSIAIQHGDAAVGTEPVPAACVEELGVDHVAGKTVAQW